MSPAVARQIELVPFPGNQVAGRILEIFRLSAVEHALLQSCRKGKAVSRCTAAELNHLRYLNSRMMVRRSGDAQLWHATRFGSACLESIAIAEHGSWPRSLAKLLSFPC